MANNLTGVDIQGLDRVQRILKGLPKEARDAATSEVADYLQNVFRTYPPRKSVTRRAAYGVTWFSDKQRKWFFAALRSGEIDVPYKRTQALRNSWRIIGKGEDKILVSENEAAVWTMSDEKQSRHERMVGWKTVSTIIKERASQIERRLQAAADKAMKKLRR